MDVVDLDLCVILPVKALEAWVRAEPAHRARWLSGDGTVTSLEIEGVAAWVFRRAPPRPTRALVVDEAKKKVRVVIAGASDDAVRAAIDAPSVRHVLADSVRIPSALMVIGADLAHADVAGGTPVAGPHRMVDLAPGAFRVELRTTGDATVIAFDAI